MIRRAIPAIAAGVALASAAPRPGHAAGEPDRTVDLRLRPTVGQAPMSVRTVVDIQRNADNRWLVVTLESAQFFRSSRIQLDGAEAPSRFDRLYEHLGPGVYDVRAELVGTGGPRGRAVGTLRVVGE